MQANIWFKYIILYPENLILKNNLVICTHSDQQLALLARRFLTMLKFDQLDKGSSSAIAEVKGKDTFCYSGPCALVTVELIQSQWKPHPAKVI